MPEVMSFGMRDPGLGGSSSQGGHSQALWGDTLLSWLAPGGTEGDTGGHRGT